MHGSGRLRGGLMTRSCCSRGSLGPPRESGSRRRCSLCGVAPRGDRHGGGEPATRVRWPFRARPRCEQPAARGGLARTHVAATDRPHARHARRGQGAVGRRSPAARQGGRPAARLGDAPEQRIPILSAALAPSSVRLAGELADHWLPFLWARSRLRDGRALLAEGEAGRRAIDRNRRRRGVPLAIAQDEETAGRSRPAGCSPI